ncbi:unnamed protein product [Eruca vesicaria subsp. sativa]|uniref:Uncharacterized protein n=1 Tax=Eruca vesicaria subsp. sativa TaxID=29727 RepID=A0ABC8JBM6_ERUVS|nr:unnamed protein product [Eruca vesicaria subsp. sativa]
MSDDGLAGTNKKKQKVADDRVASPREVNDAHDSLPCRALWGGTTPPVKRPPLAPSAAVKFDYRGTRPLVNDETACGELVRQVRGGSRLMPEIRELAFPEKYNDSARADATALARKNLLVLEYECALRKVVLELVKAEEVIKAKDTALEEMRHDISAKANEIALERSRHACEYKDAKEMNGRLEGELETTRRRVVQLEKDLADAALKAKENMDRSKQIRNREAMSIRGQLMTSADRRFGKFRKYMADRDKLEEKLSFHSQAIGALESFDLLEEWGAKDPRKLKEILVANEARLKEEVKGVEVEEIAERDLSLTPSSP